MKNIVEKKSSNDVKMKTCILAAAQGYTPENVVPWVESLKKSGYQGDTIVIVYNSTNTDLQEYLKGQGIGVIDAVHNDILNIATQRFFDFASIMEGEVGNRYDYLITVDIRDVIFQKDPDEWVRKNIGDKEIIASGEGIKYKHEDWNGDMLQKHYGDNVFEIMKNHETLCSGIIAGKKGSMIKLLKTISELCYYGVDPGDFVDQCYYNVAIRKIFNEKTKIAGGDSDWCANLGTLYAIPMNTPEWSTGSKSQYLQKQRFRTHKKFTEAMLCDLPKMINGEVCNSKGKPYAIVHQYDRYLPWKNELIAKLSPSNFVS